MGPMNESWWTIRKAETRDLPAAAALGSMLVRQHHALDPKRFALFREPMEEGYEWWLSRELANPKAVVLVAEMAGASRVVEAAASEPRVIGYAYGHLEGRDWMTLRDTAGIVEDIVVVPEARGQGVGTALARRLMQELTALGAPLLVTHVAWRNEASRAFMANLGFRQTMLEMTRGT
jgi:RimJ/RimL family protein N-acetyltransferase